MVKRKLLHRNRTIDHQEPLKKNEVKSDAPERLAVFHPLVCVTLAKSPVIRKICGKDGMMITTNET